MVLFYIVCLLPIVIGLIYYLLNHNEIKRNSEKFHSTEVALSLMLDVKWDDAFDYLEKESPHVFDSTMNELFKRIDFDDIDGKMSDEQYARFKWLDSSERRIEYYKQIPEDKMTAEDWADFKASAW